MAKTREIKRRIQSLGKTGQITKTMELVAAARMKQTQNRVTATRPYADKLREMLAAVDLEAHADRFPLLRAREEVKRAGVLVITSNRGLCGAFNVNVIRVARDLLAEKEAAGVETDPTACEFGKFLVSADRIHPRDRLRAPGDVAAAVIPRGKIPPAC